MDEDIKNKLLPYQVKHTNNLIDALKNNKRVLDASDTGTGKTYSAVAACKILGRRPIIICPKSVITNWREVLKHFNYEDKIYGIGNYELIKNCNYYDKDGAKVECPFLTTITEMTKMKNGKTKKNKIYKWNPPDDGIILFDEAHCCKNKGTFNSQLMTTLAESTTIYVMIISATICDKPENFKNFGYILGLYQNLRKYPHWLKKSTLNYYNPMIGVRKIIFPEYASRMCIRELGDLFPVNQVVAKAYDMDAAPEVQEMYELINEAQEDLKIKETHARGLAKLMRARQRIENLKIPTMIEIIKDFMEEGNSVAVFVNFTDTLKTIGEALDTKNFIYGEQTLDERDAIIKRFQDDKERIIIANIKAGGLGISLHDTNGKYPRVSVISPSWSAQDTLQAIGRVFRAKTKTPVRQRIVYCAKTYEEEICELMKDKINNIALLNDGNNKSYKIEGLMDVDISEEKNEMTEMQRLELKLQTLALKKIRLEKELSDTKSEMQSLEFIKMNYAQDLKE